MAFFATLALVFFLIFRPQEVWQFLNAFHLLDVFTALAALGVVIDFVLRRQRHPYSPQLPWLGAFVGGAFFSSVIRLGRDGLAAATPTLLLAVFMLVVMYGPRTLERLRSLMGLLVFLSAFVSCIAIHQGLAEPQCIIAPTEEESLVLSIGTPDGRPCESASSCRAGDWEADWECERVGLLNTVSTGRRVRWRGQLGDPNELSVFIGAVFPLIIALVTWQKKRWVTVAGGIAVLIGLYAIILTQSRGGLLVVGAVFVAYLVPRFGLKGLLAAGLLAAPMLLLGGRSGEEAASSAAGRTEVLYDGITFFMHSPIFGIGVNQFSAPGGYTAHNAYLLAAVELGFPGFFCWAALGWSSIKIPLMILRSESEAINAEIRTLASALLVSFAGMAIGIFFLSFTFKQLLFIWLGMPGALYGIAKNEDPTFEVRLGWKDFAGIVAFEVVILAFLYVYTRLKV